MPTSPQPTDEPVEPVGPRHEDAAVSHKDREPRDSAAHEQNTHPVEIGGRVGPEPTRFGDWEKNGRCIDF